MYFATVTKINKHTYLLVTYTDTDLHIHTQIYTYTFNTEREKNKETEIEMPAKVTPYTYQLCTSQKVAGNSGSGNPLSREQVI